MKNTIEVFFRSVLFLLIISAITSGAHAQTAESFDRFGAALTSGDYNNDGYVDLVVGARGEGLEMAGVVSTGAINVLYGTANGLSASLDQFWHRNSFEIEGVAIANDWFGASLESCDFNGDGFEDVAIGAPLSDVNGISEAGSVNILYGGEKGLSHVGNELWHQDVAGIQGVAEDNDFFGGALAAGYFDGDSYCDLAIGVDNEDLNGVSDAGAAHVLYGMHSGLSSNGSQLWYKNNVMGIVPDDWEGFAGGLTVGDYNGDSYEDLAIGIGGHDIGVLNGAGAVLILFGSKSNGLEAAGYQLITQALLDDGPQDEDIFSASIFGIFTTMASGDFNGDDTDDLAVGIPREDVESGGILYDNAGAVNVLYGVKGIGLSTGTTAQFWHQGNPAVNNIETEDNFGDVLTAGDFNGDMIDDLAISTPREDISNNTILGAGIVHVLFGSAERGVSFGDFQTWHQNSKGIKGVAEEDDNFGSALTAGDFDGDGKDDLAIGVPNESVAAGDDDYDGAVNVLYGANLGLTATGDQLWHQSSKGIDGDGNPVAGIENKAGDLTHDTLRLTEVNAHSFTLAPNFPNPFSTKTAIRFSIEEGIAESVSLEVYDVMGKRVRLLVNSPMPGGQHEVLWDGHDEGGQALAAGVYFYRLQQGNRLATQMMTLLR